MTLTARPTIYNGIQMRSRLEATVASNFERWGYDWRYEYRAFASPDGQYLPDFELWIDNRLRTVVEVKGEMVDRPAEVFRRMEIVWRSEPNAYLLLIEAEAIQNGFYRTTGRPRASMLFRTPGLEDGIAVGAVFALCTCGTVGLRLPISGDLIFRCRGCGSSDGVIAYVDPTEYRG